MLWLAFLATLALGGYICGRMHYYNVVTHAIVVSAVAITVAPNNWMLMVPIAYFWVCFPLGLLEAKIFDLRGIIDPWHRKTPHRVDGA